MRRSFAPIACVFAITAILMGYYCWRVTGSVTTLPYQVSFRTYLYRRMFIWGHNRPEPVYRHPMMKKAYAELNRPWVTWKTRVIVKFVDPLRIYFWWLTLGFLLLLPVVWADRRIRPLLAFAAAMFIALALEEWVNPHYSAPIAAACYGIAVQELRHIHAWRAGSWNRNRSGAHTGLAGTYRCRNRIRVDLWRGTIFIVSSLFNARRVEAESRKKAGEGPRHRSLFSRSQPVRGMGV